MAEGQREEGRWLDREGVLDEGDAGEGMEIMIAFMPASPKRGIPII